MHHATTRPRPADVGRLSGRQPWLLLILLCAAQFMVVIDMTVVNVALPSIGKALGFAGADLPWVVTAYVLLSGGLVLLGGRIADLLGGRPIFLLGLLTFTVASLASGLAPSPAALIASRAAQGLGAALLTPAALSLITTTYAGAQRAAGLAAWGAIGASGAAAGVLLGGALTTWLGWQWVFFINIPIGATVAALAWHLVPATPPSGGRPRDLDIAGALTVTAGLALLVYAIEGTAAYGWGSTRTLLPLILSAGSLVMFAAIERRAARPLLAPALWRVGSLVSGVAVMLGASGIMGGAFFLSSLYLQRVLGDSALEAGLAFLPLAGAVLLAAHLASHLLPHLGTRAVLVLGLLITVGGALYLARVPDHAAYLGSVLPGFLALGLGLGLTFVAVLIGAMAEVRGDDAGLASGLLSTGHEIGAALGVALLSAVATAGAGQTTFAAGYRDGLLVAAVIAVAGALLALAALPSVRPSGTGHMGLHGGHA